MLLNPDLQVLLGLPAVIFSDPLFNAGFDLFGAFPSLADPLTPGTGFFALMAPEPTLLGLYITGTLSPVPAPVTLVLVLTGLAGVLFARRRECYVSRGS